jgi:dTDP-glucose 4,6-dehydratase
VEDHCQAIQFILQNGRLGETYAVGGGNQWKNIDLVETLCSILDDLRPESPHCPHKSLITFVVDRPGHDRRYAMNIGKIGRELGWIPHERLESGLRKTVGWYLENGEWIQAIRKEQGYREWVEKNYAGRGGNT